MDINKLTKDELEKMSYLDMAYNILKYNKKVYTTVELLKEICDVLEYGEDKFESLVGDFYTSLNLDKRFLLIDGKWDLTLNHSVKILVEDELDEDLDEYEETDEDLDDEEIEDDLISEDVEVLEDIDEEIEDDLEELSIIDEEEEVEEDI